MGVEMFEIIQIIFGAVFVLFVPGFALSFVFFPKKEIDWVERIALSFGLSIAIIPLIMFYLNRFLSVPLTTLTSAIVILTIVTISWIIYLKRTKRFPYKSLAKFLK